MSTAASRVLSLTEALVDGAGGSASRQVANEIIRQIKAMAKWALMSWSADEFIALDAGVQFRVKGSKIQRGGMVQITLNGRDTYDVRLLRVSGTNVKEVGAADDVNVEQLVEVLDYMIG